VRSILCLEPLASPVLVCLRAALRRREPAQNEGTDARVGIVDLRVAPLGRVRWIVEAARRVEGSARRRPWVRGGEFALRDTVRDDPCELVDECLDVDFDDVPGVGGELDVGREELGVVERLAPLRLDEAVEPAPQARGRSPLPAATASSGCEISESQRSVTASRSAALLGKWR
jgi:hypothetical protein